MGHLLHPRRAATFISHGFVAQAVGASSAVGMEPQSGGRTRSFTAPTEFGASRAVVSAVPASAQPAAPGAAALQVRALPSVAEQGRDQRLTLFSTPDRVLRGASP